MNLKGVVQVVSLVGFVVATVVAALAYFPEFRVQVRDQVVSWLREQKLDKSILMDAWIVLEQNVSAIRCRIFLKFKETEEVRTIYESTYSLDEIDDLDVLSELNKRGYFETNIMSYLE